MNKKIWWIIGALAIVVVALIVLKKTGVLGKDDTIQVAVEVVQRRTIVETVSASGKVYPEDERKVSSDVSGEIVDLYVEEGDSVRKGQLVARVYADILSSAKERASSVVSQQQAQVSNAEAALASFKARLDQAKFNYDRQKKLLDDKVISRAEFEQAESQFLSARADYNAAQQTIASGRASVRSAEATLTEANKNLSRTSIVAPMDGIVSLLAVKKGERVVGTAQMAGTEMLRVADMSKIEVRVDVSENDVTKVHIGDSANVEVDAYNNRIFKGVVTKIASSSSSATATTAAAGDVTSYKVHIRLNPDSYADLIDPSLKKNLPFRPGMSASADIMTRKHDQVLAVPILAVTTRDKNEENADAKAKADADKKKANSEDNGMNETVSLEDMQEVVFIVKEDGTVTKAAIRTDIQDNEYIETLSGVKEGDKVVSAPYNTISKILKEGTKVKVVEKEKVYDQK